MWRYTKMKTNTLYISTSFLIMHAYCIVKTIVCYRSSILLLTELQHPNSKKLQYH
jgi:hypothetical protein